MYILFCMLRYGMCHVTSRYVVNYITRMEILVLAMLTAANCPASRYPR